MDQRVLKWLTLNRGSVFPSPRNALGGRETKDFEIKSILSDRVYIRFGDQKNVALPLTFGMFDRVLACLAINSPHPVRLGAKVAPPYDNDTIEGAIWQTPYPVGTVPYKSSPHVCDILSLAGLVQYVWIANPLTGRQVQAVKMA